MNTAATTALLMIDFQRDFCAPGGYASRYGGVGWAQEIIPAARRLLLAARAAGVFVVHTREGYAADLADCSPSKLERSRRAGAEIGSPGPLGRLLIRGEHGHDFVDELAPLAGELVIDKPTYGAFCHSPLEDHLRWRGIQCCAIAGVTADVCVHTTLREATDRGYHCQYVRDAISTFDPHLRRVCEDMVAMEGGVWGEVVTVGQLVVSWLSADPATPPTS
ncbi:MAG TPA: isochorismatase family cysteine hydrolase [Opitutaceae bacterium]|nr:isochorismatase family cysteine hydrolase [Opitutaceae bacterium]